MNKFYFIIIISLTTLLSFSLPQDNGKGIIEGKIILTQDTYNNDKTRADSALCVLYKVNISVDSFDLNEGDAYWRDGIPYDLVKIDSSIFLPISSTLSDKKGEFRFTNIDNGNYLLRVYYYPGYHWFTSNVKIDTLKNKISLKIEYPKYCAYYHHRNSNICPKCKKHDKVISIYYGEPTRQAIIAADKGELFLNDNGTCGPDECSPTWYCKRDTLKF